MIPTRILVVDDEVTMLHSVERVLRSSHEVSIASTPAEALEAVREHRPQLAVIDIRMPELDGFEVMSRLREVHPELDVIFMTGAVHELDSQLIRAIREKAFYFIQKPFDREVLLTLVDRCLEQRRLSDENRAYLSNLEAELAAARTFQESMIPPLTARFGPASIVASYQPCETLGGDLFDYADVGDGRCALLVADVSGHGVGAAMLTGIVKSAFHRSSDKAWAPDVVARRVASALAPFEADRFVTLFAGRFDPARSLLEYVDAGHPTPFLTGTKTRTTQLSITGPLISPAFPDLGWTMEHVKLSPGDQLLVYTDGLTEARGEQGFYGEERIAALLESTERRGPELLAELLESIERFTGGRPADDDRTVATVTIEV